MTRFTQSADGGTYDEWTGEEWGNGSSDWRGPKLMFYGPLNPGQRALINSIFNPPAMMLGGGGSPSFLEVSRPPDSSTDGEPPTSISSNGADQGGSAGCGSSDDPHGSMGG